MNGHLNLSLSVRSNILWQTCKIGASVSKWHISSLTLFTKETLFSILHECDSIQIKTDRDFLQQNYSVFFRKKLITPQLYKGFNTRVWQPLHISVPMKKDLSNSMVTTNNIPQQFINYNVILKIAKHNHYFTTSCKLKALVSKIIKTSWYGIYW